MLYEVITIRKRLRMPESYEHVGTCSCAEGWKLRILTTFKAKSYRGDASLIRLLAEMAPDGAVITSYSIHYTKLYEVPR